MSGKISKELLCFTVIMVITMSQANYQERVIYYSERDNVCSAGLEADTFELTIRLEGYPLLKV